MHRDECYPPPAPPRSPSNDYDSPRPDCTTPLLRPRRPLFPASASFSTPTRNRFRPPRFPLASQTRHRRHRRSRLRLRLRLRLRPRLRRWKSRRCRLLRATPGSSVFAESCRDDVAAAPASAGLVESPGNTNTDAGSKIETRADSNRLVAIDFNDAAGSNVRRNRPRGGNVTALCS